MCPIGPPASGNLFLANQRTVPSFSPVDLRRIETMDLKLPTLGEGADSGTVVAILVKEGDTIAKGQNVLELETGKAVSPIPASAGGKITKITVSEGQKISVGAVILQMEGGAGEAAAPAAKPAAKASAPKAAGPAKKRTVAAAPVEEAGEVEGLDEPFDDETPVPPASQTVRWMADTLDIDLRAIGGSGQGGRVTTDDFKGYISRLRGFAARALAPKAEAVAAAPIKKTTPLPDFTQFGSILKKPMSSLRKVIAQRMAENAATIPHVTQFESVDITDLMALRKRHMAAYEAKGGKLTLTCFVIKALTQTLKKYPIFNSSVDEANEEFILKEYINIGLAVDTEQGLFVPVIKDADKKDLLTLSKELADLAVRTRDRKITAADLSGGSFTISNQGAIGGGHYTPIINKPEVAILGVGKGSFQAVVTDPKAGKIESRLMMPIALSYDHRAIDGGDAVRFTQDLMAALVALNDDSVKL
jgi:pyruvate dehydrogenase E2 component (dihydrolipoamide acetyltransferase)